jgi:hypothetical protein
MSRSDGQLRQEVCWHEASHCVAAFILEMPIDRVELNEGGGCVELKTRSDRSIHDAEDRIVVYLAGEAGLRAAWVEGAFDAEAAGRTEPAPPLTVEDVLAAGPGAAPAVQAAYYGIRDTREDDDGQAAWSLASEWTESSMAAASLLGWCKSRTAELVATPRFQGLLGALADTLIERGPLLGIDVEHLLHRTNVVLRQREGVSA